MVGECDFECNREAKAHAAFALGKEGVAPMEESFLGKAWSGVVDLKAEVGVRLLKVKADNAHRRGGLERIEDEVGEGLMKAVGVAEDRGWGAVAGGDEADLGVSGLGLKELAGAGLNGCEINRNECWGRGAREMEPLRDKVLDAGGFALNELLRLPAFGVRRAFEQLGVQANGGEGIPDFVGETGGHAAEDGEALGFGSALAFAGEGGVGILEAEGELADFVRAMSG